MTSPHPAPAATGPGDPHLYNIAAALAVTVENLADAVDDNRPGWLDIAVNVGDLLDTLVIAKLDADTDTDLAAVPADSRARAASEPVTGTGETATGVAYVLMPVRPAG